MPSYLQDPYWHMYASRYNTFGTLRPADFKGSPAISICIPSYAEPDLINTLTSLLNCRLPEVEVEVLVLFNQDERMSDFEKALHRGSYERCLLWVEDQKYHRLKFYPLWVEADERIKWGVGWARKRLMDEAVLYLSQDGILLCLDADCEVAENYIVAVWDHFKRYPACDAAVIYLEHNLDILSAQEKGSIIDYELHLRYLVNAQRWAGHPLAYQTFGSAMAVRRSAYLAQGGMNTRQAGEDFYFLQKFVEIGKLMEINDTVVYASSRTSLRVPFGTGKAMHQIQQESVAWKTTSFEIFQVIKPLFDQVSEFRNWVSKQNDLQIWGQLKLDARLVTYLESIQFLSHVRTITENTATQDAFRKRFFRYFNAFAMIRYMHAMRDRYFADCEIEGQVVLLCEAMQIQVSPGTGKEALLKVFRKIDRGN